MCLYAGAAAAQGKPMTLADVLARAREQAPEIVSARLAVDEARARLVGASPSMPANPEVDVAFGHRTGSSHEFELGYTHPLAPGSRRTGRIAAANAAIDRSLAHIDEVTRIMLRAAASAFMRAVHAGERVRLLAGAEELSATIHSIADRRFRAGDIAVLDVNIARAALGRVRSDREGAEADRALALGELRQLLRLDAVEVEGTLTPRPDPDLNAALQAAAARPELRVLEAAIKEAEGELQYGQGLGKPDYALGARYEREEDDQIFLGALTISLPTSVKGQEQRAAATARAARLRHELSAAQERIRFEVRAAVDANARRRAALRVLESEAMPGLGENEQLTTRSFEVGQLGLPELLLLRREILDTRAQYLDALLEAALAQIDLDASAAILR
jgi:cobalt-zinc-cadmium efflux system outer membrane protein